MISNPTRGWLSSLASSAFILTCLCTSAPSVQGQQPPNGAARQVSVPLLLAQLKSANDSTRMTCFYALLRASKAPKPFNAATETDRLLRDYSLHAPSIRRAFVELLTRENASIFGDKTKDFPEVYGVYHGDLIASVASLHEPSAVDALFGALSTGGLAAEGLAALGDKAAPRLLAAATAKDWPVRRDIALALGSMIDRRAATGLSPINVARIRLALLRFTDDSEPFVRQFAVSGLGAFTDIEVEAKIRKLAISDADCAIRVGQRTCPVKDAALEVLRKRGMR